MPHNAAGQAGRLRYIFRTGPLPLASRRLPALRIAWIGLALFGLAILARPLAGHVKRFCLHQLAKHRWEEIRSQPAACKPGSPMGWLTIDDAAIDTLVLNKITGEQLNRFPCGEPINRATLIIAHRDTHFRGLNNVRPGSRIELERPGGDQTSYQIVDRIITEAQQTEELIRQLAAPGRLLLLTCYPFRYIGPAPQRILFIAEPLKSRASVPLA